MDNFLEFITDAETIFLENKAKLQNEYALFLSLDNIYQKPIQNIDSKLNSKDPDVIREHFAILSLYNLAHFNLYFSTFCFLRNHFSEGLFHCRKGIDAGFTAYKIILEPKLAGVYWKGAGKEYKDIFGFIKKHIKKEIKKRSDKYPLANDLLGVYEICNPHSHADVRTIDLFPEKSEILTFEKFYNFHSIKCDNKYKRWFILNLLAFLKIFYIFKLFFDDKFQVNDVLSQSSLDEFRLKLENEHLNILRKSLD